MITHNTNEPNSIALNPLSALNVMCDHCKAEVGWPCMATGKHHYVRAPHNVRRKSHAKWYEAFQQCATGQNEAPAVEAAAPAPAVTVTYQPLSMAAVVRGRRTKVVIAKFAFYVDAVEFLIKCVNSIDYEAVETIDSNGNGCG